MNISLGIMAYNEEQNIGRLLGFLVKEPLADNQLIEIIVVASGCTDRTCEIVQDMAETDDRVQLVQQEKRQGKASAINLFLSMAQGDILVLESADTLPAKGTLDALLAPFSNPEIGMTGGRPVPVNSPDNFTGFAVQLLWSLHHKIALLSPKMGELVAFRNCVTEIPPDTAVDEASIEAIILKKGLTLCYVPEAIVMNKGPDTVREFVRQRRRIAAGHMQLLKQEDHKVSTTGTLQTIQLLLTEKNQTLRSLFWTIGVVGIEAFSRILGLCDYLLHRKNHTVWDISTSTKNLD